MTKHATRGVIFIHSVSPTVQPHVEWAVSSVLGYEVHFEWTTQPAQPSMNRAEISWVGEVGTGAMLASALGGWEHLRFENSFVAEREVDGHLVTVEVRVEGGTGQRM